MKRYWMLGLLMILCLGVSLGAGDAASEEVVIGSAYPLTGSVASAGLDSKTAIDLAVDIINNKHDLELPLAKTTGLPNLGGAKPSQNSRKPATVARAERPRLAQHSI